MGNEKFKPTDTNEVKISEELIDLGIKDFIRDEFVVVRSQHDITTALQEANKIPIAPFDEESYISNPELMLLLAHLDDRLRQEPPLGSLSSAVILLAQKTLEEGNLPARRHAQKPNYYPYVIAEPKTPVFYEIQLNEIWSLQAVANQIAHTLLRFDTVKQRMNMLQDILAHQFGITNPNALTRYPALRGFNQENWGRLHSIFDVAIVMELLGLNSMQIYFKLSNLRDSSNLTDARFLPKDINRIREIFRQKLRERFLLDLYNKLKIVKNSIPKEYPDPLMGTDYITDQLKKGFSNASDENPRLQPPNTTQRASSVHIALKSMRIPTVALYVLQKLEDEGKHPSIRVKRYIEERYGRHLIAPSQEVTDYTYLYPEEILWRE